MCRHDPAHTSRIAFGDRLPEALDRRHGVGPALDDMIAERPPAHESILAGEHELGVSERDGRFVGELGADACDRFAIAGVIRSQKVLSELLLLLEVRTRGQRPAECG